MTIVKKTTSGDYYLFKYRGGKRNNILNLKNIFLIRHSGNGYTGEMSTSKTITFPKELIGKRVMLRVEIIE